MIEIQGNPILCSIACVGGCLVGCAAPCALDGPLPFGDVFGATVVNLSASVLTTSACDNALPF